MSVRSQSHSSSPFICTNVVLNQPDPLVLRCIRDAELKGEVIVCIVLDHIQHWGVCFTTKDVFSCCIECLNLVVEFICKLRTCIQ